MSCTLLKLAGPDGSLELRTTDDDSTTRLCLDLEHRGHGVTSELNVDEALALRAALTGWLDDGGHLDDEPGRHCDCLEGDHDE